VQCPQILDHYSNGWNSERGGEEDEMSWVGKGKEVYGNMSRLLITKRKLPHSSPSRTG